MPELPGRPNLDQLRHQARELLRAAADGEPAALARIQAFSPRVSLSAAQLAIAREHGAASWSALRAEVQRRLAGLSPGGPGARRPGTRWTFGGATPISTAAGVLYPGGLVAGAGYAVLDASLLPSPEFQNQAAMPPRDSSARAAFAEASAKAMNVLTETITGAITLTDDQAKTYALRVQQIWGSPAQQGREREQVSLRLGVDPVPARDSGWLELRGLDGSAARLVPSARPHTRVSHLAAVPDTPAERELAEQALRLIGLRLAGSGPDALERHCSHALARAVEFQQSGKSGATADLSGQLARLCAFLTAHGPAAGLPHPWSGMLQAADRADGPDWHLDLGVALPAIDGFVVLADSLISQPRSWRVYLRAEPGWWIYSADQHSKRAIFSVCAEDGLGGMYLSEFSGSAGRGGHEEVILRFRPRLNPLTRTLTLTFSQTARQVTVELRLP